MLDSRAAISQHSIHTNPFPRSKRNAVAAAEEISALFISLLTENVPAVLRVRLDWSNSSDRWIHHELVAVCAHRTTQESWKYSCVS